MAEKILFVLPWINIRSIGTAKKKKKREHPVLEDIMSSIGFWQNFIAVISHIFFLRSLALPSLSLDSVRFSLSLSLCFSHNRRKSNRLRYLFPNSRLLATSRKIQFVKWNPKSYGICKKNKLTEKNPLTI